MHSPTTGKPKSSGEHDMQSETLVHLKHYAAASWRFIAAENYLFVVGCYFSQTLNFENKNCSQGTFNMHIIFAKVNKLISFNYLFEDHG